jgi:hypothetical protein
MTRNLGADGLEKARVHDGARGAGIFKEGVYGAVGDFNPATSHGVIQEIVQLRYPTKVLNAIVSPVPRAN